LAAASATALRAQRNRRIPAGLQLVAVGRNLQQDLPGTLRAVAKMGYEVVEFSANPYFGWSPADAKRVRGILDDVNLRCRSTHNEIVSFSDDGLSKAIELNQIIGSDTLVSVRGPSGTPAGGGRASGGPPPPPAGLDAWKRFNDQLSHAAERIHAAKMTLGFHNHDIEFKLVEGTRPIDLLAQNKDITSFHVNLGLCLRGGGDPIAFIRQCPGRIQSVLCQDYEGKAVWKELFAAAESLGGLQFYLIQRTDGLSLVPREGTDLLDFAQKDLEYFRQLHG
jgi:sugar phosphate isomerase/epimerase